MKLTILGGAGSRSLMLIKSLARQAQELGIDQLIFMDIDEYRLKIFGEMVVKASSLLAPELNTTYTNNAEEALANADFVITTIRVGGEQSRVTDERIALKHGILGQETTGAGGFAMALRSIPILADYCKLIKKVSKPNVMVFNFTNPSGLVTQAMRDLGYDFVYGICDAPSSFLRQVAALYNYNASDLKVKLIGLNHLSYFTSINFNGREILPEILENPGLYTHTDMRYFEPALAQHLGCLLNEYLYYYYYREHAVQNIQHTGKTRGECIAEINRQMLKELECMNVNRDFDRMLEIYTKYTLMREANYMSSESSINRNTESIESFDLYTLDNGGYAGVALAFMRAKITGLKSEMILSVPNNGTLDWLEDNDIIEVSCYISNEGAFPKKVNYNLPESVKQLISNIKYYERNISKAILTKDTNLAIDSLMLHPLINSYSLAKEILNDYLENYKKYTGGWTI